MIFLLIIFMKKDVPTQSFVQVSLKIKTAPVLRSLYPCFYVFTYVIFKTYTHYLSISQMFLDPCQFKTDSSMFLFKPLFLLLLGIIRWFIFVLLTSYSVGNFVVLCTIVQGQFLILNAYHWSRYTHYFSQSFKTELRNAA